MADRDAPPAAELRLLCLGDRWAYQVTGSLTPPGGEPLPVSGSIEVSIEEDRLLSRSSCMAIVFSQRFTITQPDGSTQPMPAPEWIFSFVQDPASRELAIAADNMTRDGSPRIAQAPQVFYPGTWSAGTAYRNRLAFDNGDHVDNTLAVLGSERVKTPAGEFSSWLAEISSESAATGLIQGTDWWTPELGAPAQFATSSRMPDGSQMRFVATLESTNVR